MAPYNLTHIIECRNSLASLLGAEFKGNVKQLSEGLAPWILEQINFYGKHAVIGGIETIYSEKSQPSLKEIKEAIANYVYRPSVWR